MHTENIPTSYHLGTYSRACVRLTDELHGGSECRERRGCEVGKIEDHTGKGCGARDPYVSFEGVCCGPILLRLCVRIGYGRLLPASSFKAISSAQYTAAKLPLS